jgi:hypothetical protein
MDSPLSGGVQRLYAWNRAFGMGIVVMLKKKYERRKELSWREPPRSGLVQQLINEVLVSRILPSSSVNDNKKNPINLNVGLLKW